MLRVLNELDYVLNVLNKPIDASLACWALLISLSYFSEIQSRVLISPSQQGSLHHQHNYGSQFQLEAVLSHFEPLWAGF